MEADHVGPGGERWVEGFLAANRALLRRLDVRAAIEADRGVRVVLHPGSRIGAVPLVGPVTRKVEAGLLVEPRFRWRSLGAVFGAIGFSVEPSLGGTAMVPASAREVPPWLLAAPVIRRLAALLADRRRSFAPRREERASPRGRVDWTRWSTVSLPRGRWTAFPCSFTEPDDDPDLLAAVRWTLVRLADELQTVAVSPPARILLGRAAELSARLGPGLARRPPPDWFVPGAPANLLKGIEAMGWVSDERGLGGGRALDGLPWDLAIDEVWEAWVAAFAGALARRTGLVASPYGGVRREIRWSGPVTSMGSLVPDVELRGDRRVVLIDAKYKRHLALLARHGFRGLADEIRDAHRADLHQALAYAAITEADRVDTVLAYPHQGERSDPPATLADLTVGRRRVRLILTALPFAFRGEADREATLARWRELLAA